MRRRLVLLQVPLGRVDRIQVRVGARTIEAATSFTPAQISALHFDDLAAVKKAMIK